MVCNNCGTENQENVKFCSECGAKLNNIEKDAKQVTEQNISENNSNKSQRKYNTSGIVMLCIGIVCLIDTIVEIMMGSKSFGILVIGPSLIIGGLYFMHNKKKKHWIVYIVVAIVAGICNNIIPLVLQ